MKHRLSLLLITLLALVLSASMAGAAGSGLQWQGWDSGLKDAGKSQRPVLVDVYTDWCGWCRRMEKDVYSRAEVKDYLSKKFVIVKLNAESSESARYEGRSWTSRSLASRFQVTGYPTTIFLRSNGEHLANLPGYIAADRFLLLLRYVGDGAMDRGLSFEEFSRTAGPSPAR
jgi:thioredoxin-related protein